MPNEYSVEIHNFLSKEIAEIMKKQEENHNQPYYLEGRLAELQWLRKYLEKHIDLKNYTYY